VTVLVNKTARIWDVAVDVEAPLPEWFAHLLEALGGKRLNEVGSIIDADHGLWEVQQPERPVFVGNEHEQCIWPRIPFLFGRLRGCRAGPNLSLFPFS
jgi:hypothetical protein